MKKPDLFIDFGEATIVFTGFETEDLINLRGEAEALGAKVSGTVSLSTTLVVVNSKETSRAKKAADLGIKMCSIDQWREIVAYERHLAEPDVFPLRIEFHGAKGSGKTLLSRRVEKLLKADGLHTSRRRFNRKQHKPASLTDDNLTDDLFVHDPVSLLVELQDAVNDVAVFLTKDEAETIEALRNGTAAVVLKSSAHVVNTVTVSEDVDLEEVRETIEKMEPGVIVPLKPADQIEFKPDPFTDYYLKQIDWSLKTFGPAPRTKGILDHIRKEIGEIERAPYDLMEWIDLATLALDGFHRHGGNPHMALELLKRKQAKNFARLWPDWRTKSEDQAIEHDRSGE